MRKWLVLLLLVGLCGLTQFVSAQARSKPVGTANDIQQAKAESRPVEHALSVLSFTLRFQQVAISPDGTHVAWVQNQRRDGASGNGIYVAEINSPKNIRIITASPDATWEDQIAWSPDSRQLAFLSNGNGSSGQQQLFVADLAACGFPGIRDRGAAGRKATNHDAARPCTRQFTELTGFLSSPAWSPDGQSIAFLFIENSPRAGGPLQPMTPPSGVIEEQIYEQRLNVVDIAGGNVRAVSAANMYIYEYDWMPDASGFVAVAAYGNGDNNWWIAQLYAVNLDPSHPQPQSLFKPALQIANPRISPDGKNVAFIAGLMSDQGVVGGDVWMASLRCAFHPCDSDSEVISSRVLSIPRNLTPNLPASATSLVWSDPAHIVFSELVDGNSGVASVDLDGKFAQLWSAPELITAAAYDVSISLARDGRRSAVVRSSAEHPPEVWAGSIGGWQQITKDADKSRPWWGEQRNLHWQSDGFRVQGWLLFPHDYHPAKHYALIVNVHGGPAAACSPGWPTVNEAPFAAEDYFVLCPNPRGSFGQGEAFTRANVKDFGGGDFRDIMAGVDQVVREFPIDPQRIGIQGWSYGGFMAMWAETQTTRFAAAVVGAGLSDWTSYYGENDIDQWMIPYFGASVYDDPAVYAKSQPINYVKNVKTPTLILVGDRDGECPAPQSFEWWHALQTFHVPVQFVVYPNEGHAIQQSRHRHDVIVRTLDWFDKYLRDEPGPMPVEMQ